MRDTHESLKEKFLSDPINKAEYDKLEEEYKELDKKLQEKEEEK